ncbi:MAG: Asp-tRNA(Asn)/Glu-tRNA(Gln) amidotransferase subunit GatB [Dehalococcoidales bacterium]|nr:MAG: Asp-tRNA(Asn)/Glu-tRNA(Gln) amidotransferase subunit GatB [Dehalococcoidales bacterium]
MVSGTNLMDYETIIGLEVHAQLLTKSKMFCRCSAEYADAPPNSHVCPVCMGMPGVLPVINSQAVDYTIMTALALNCPVSEFTRFDRKNYPYPDLVKGYQISQSGSPISGSGWLSIDVDGVSRKIGINHIHLEEDTSKLLHRSESNGEDYSLVDINRSGVPLMEIVSEPDLRSPEEARQYLMKLRTILRYIGVSTGNMEEGSFRCDANISIRPEGSEELGPKVEVKNLNSFRAVFLAMEYEEKRQRKAVEKGEKLVQETRGWVEDRGVTVSQRSKEYAHDYRYFPEPDLPPMVLTAVKVEAIRAKLPELPDARRDRFIDEYELTLYDADLLTGSREMADYEEEFIQAGESGGMSVPERAKLGSNWILGEVSRIMNANGIDITGFEEKVSAVNLEGLAELNSKGKISAATAKSMLEEMYNTGKDADILLKEGDRGQINDSDQLEEAISQAIAANDQAVADYRAGKEAAVKFLVGQVMKVTRGRANPQLVNELMKKKLEEVIS